MTTQDSLDLTNQSPEGIDNSLQDVDETLSNIKTGVETDALRNSIEVKNEQAVMLDQISNLLNKYKSLRKGIKSTEGNRATRKQLESWLDQNIKKLQDIERDLNSGHNYQNLTKYKNDIGELMAYYEHYEQVRQEIVVGGSTSNIHAVIDSKQDARRARRLEKIDVAQHQNMNAILHDAAITSLWNNDMEGYENYLKSVVNGQVKASSHPFYKSHTQSFKIIQQRNPNVYQILVPSGTGRIQYYAPTVGGVVEGGTYSTNRRVVSGQNESFSTKIGRAIGQVAESLIPSVNRDPRQKQAWEQAGSVVALAGAAIMGFNVLKNIFSSKTRNPNKRGDAAKRGAGLLALTNSDKIFNWVQDITGWHPSEKIKLSTELFERYGFSNADALAYSEMHIGAPVAVMNALQFIPIYDLNAQNIVQYRGDEFKFNYDNYRRYIENCNRTNEQKNVALSAGKKIDDENTVNLGLVSLGIKDGNQLNSLANQDKSKTLAQCPEIQQAWSENAELVSSKVHAELYKEGLKAKTPEAAKQIVNEYNQNGGKDIKKSELNNLIIGWMRSGLLEVNQNVEYDLDDILNDPDINLQKKTMEGFNNSGGTPIKFESYKDLFNTVQLTHRIKYNFKGRPAKSEKPFHIAVGGRVEFDDQDFWTIRGDTDITKARTLAKTAPTLSGNKQFYVDYLNNRRISGGKDGVGEDVESLISPIHTELRNQGLKAKDSQCARQIVYEYNQKGGKDIKKSDLHNLIVRWLNAGWLKMNDPEKKYDIGDMISNPNIDLTNKSINGFENDGGTPIKFESYEELFDIMYLTRWIKYNFKGRPAKTDDPFHIEHKTGRVEFDNQPFWKIRKGDLDVLRARTLTQTSSTLKGNKQFYVDYLNDWRINLGKNGFM